MNMSSSLTPASYLQKYENTHLKLLQLCLNMRFASYTNLALVISSVVNFKFYGYYQICWL